jgi:hypothetical protein
LTLDDTFYTVFVFFYKDQSIIIDLVNAITKRLLCYNKYVLPLQLTVPKQMDAMITTEEMIS